MLHVICYLWQGLLARPLHPSSVFLQGSCESAAHFIYSNQTLARGLDTHTHTHTHTHTQPHTHTHTPPPAPRPPTAYFSQQCQPPCTIEEYCSTQPLPPCTIDSTQLLPPCTIDTTQLLPPCTIEVYNTNTATLCHRGIQDNHCHPVP